MHLQFEKSSKIHQIDIGNEGSAFVEVLVGKSSQTSEQDYQVNPMIVSNDFQTPLWPVSMTHVSLDMI